MKFFFPPVLSLIAAVALLDGCQSGQTPSADFSNTSEPTITINVQTQNGNLISPIGSGPGGPYGAVAPAGAKVIFVAQGFCTSGIHQVTLNLQSWTGGSYTIPFSPQTQGTENPANSQASSFQNWVFTATVPSIAANQLLAATATITDFHNNTVTTGQVLVFGSQPSMAFTQTSYYFGALSGVGDSMLLGGTPQLPYTVTETPIGPAGIAAANLATLPAATGSIPIGGISIPITMTSGSQGGALLVTASSAVQGVPVSTSAIVYSVATESGGDQYQINDAFVSAIVPPGAGGTAGGVILTLIGQNFNSLGTVNLEPGNESGDSTSNINPGPYQHNSPYDQFAPSGANSGLPNSPNQANDFPPGYPQTTLLNVFIPATFNCPATSTTPPLPNFVTGSAYTVWLYHNLQSQGEPGRVDLSSPVKFNYAPPPQSPQPQSTPSQCAGG